MGEIIGFNGRAIPAENGAEPKIVRILEETLEEAKRGDITAIGLAVVKRQGKVSMYWESPGGDGHLLVAAAEYLRHELVSYSLNEASDSVSEG